MPNFSQENKCTLNDLRGKKKISVNVVDPGIKNSSV